MKLNKSIFASIFVLIFLPATLVYAQPNRVGTTAVSILEIGFGSAGNAMGDAYVSMVSDLSAIYWNPAGLAFMQQNEAQFLFQPWIAGINTAFTGVGLVLPRVGTLALSVFHSDYGKMEVTNMVQQEGTGEIFTPRDFDFGISYARKLAEWFSFGVTAKFVTSQIWHTNASAVAVDLGVVVITRFFSATGERSDGMRIGMSIANYGTRMKYDGIDLINPIDIAPNEAGNFHDAPGQFRLNEWELPLIFRIGISVRPYVSEKHNVTLSVDALHPNNNSESVNIGVQYKLKPTSVSTFYLRSGFKGMFMNKSEFGPSFGGGFEFRLMHNIGLRFDYAYRGIGVLGNTHSYSLGVLF